MNISIDPISCKILDKYLYQDNNLKTFSNCKIIGVSSYLNQTLTFHALIDNGSIYSDLPIIAFFKSYVNNDFKLEDVSNFNCKTLDIDIFNFNILLEKNINVFIQNKKQWYVGKYLLSIDFYSGNELFHLIEINNNTFGLFPNHKINIYKKNLPDYKKNKNIWAI